jgi:integrase
LAAIHPQKKAVAMPLSDSACRNAKPKGKLYKLADSGGLCLRVTPQGGKYWTLRYRFGGKQKDLSFGTYPSVSLAEVRGKRDNARKLLRDGVDPSVARLISRHDAILSSTTTFEAVSREWIKVRSSSISKRYAALIQSRFEKDLFPEIGPLPIDGITAPRLLSTLRRVQERGANETGVRLRQYCAKVFKFARASGITRNNPADDLQDAMVTPKSGHFASIDVEDLPSFLKKLSDSSVSVGMQTRSAIRLLMLTLVRTSELIGATWDEIDLEKATWIIPAKRMKKERDHIVPLSRQAVDILKVLRKMTTGTLVFQGRNDRKKSISNSTILVGLYRMGYKGAMTGHGFRSLAMSTIKEKLGYRHEVVDRQLAHAPGNKVDRAYDRAKFLDERRKMMQEYADYIDRIECEALKKKR